MANEGGSSSIGAVSVDIIADPSHMQAGFTAARVASQQFATTVTADTAKATNSFIQFGKEVQNTTRQAIQFITKTTGTIAIMGATAQGVVKIIESLEERFNDGEVAALKFGAAIGAGVGPEAASRVEALKKKLIELEEELAKKATSSTFRQAFIDRSDATINAEKRRVADQLELASEQLKAQRDDERRKKRAAEEKKRVQEEEREKLSIQKEGFEELRKLRERTPLDKAQNELDDSLDIVRRLKKAGDPIGNFLAENIEKAAIDGFKRAKEEIKQLFIEAISDAMNEAVNGQTNQFGIGNMTTLLSQIGMKVDGIKAALPRRWG